MSIYFRVFLQVTFRTDFWVEVWTAWAHRARFSYERYCKTHLLTELVCYGVRRRFESSFGGLGGCFSDFLLPWRQAWELMDFDGVTYPISGGCRRQTTWNSWLVNSLTADG